MINPKIIGMLLIVSAASIGLVTIGFQSTMVADVFNQDPDTPSMYSLSDIDISEIAEALLIRLS